MTPSHVCWGWKVLRSYIVMYAHSRLVFSIKIHLRFNFMYCDAQVGGSNTHNGGNYESNCPGHIKCEFDNYISNNKELDNPRNYYINESRHLLVNSASWCRLVVAGVAHEVFDGISMRSPVRRCRPFIYTLSEICSQNNQLRETEPNIWNSKIGLRDSQEKMSTAGMVMADRYWLVFDLLISGNYLKIPDEYALASTCQSLWEKIEYKSRRRLDELAHSLDDKDERR